MNSTYLSVASRYNIHFFVLIVWCFLPIFESGCVFIATNYLSTCSSLPIVRTPPPGAVVARRGDVAEVVTEGVASLVAVVPEEDQGALGDNHVT